MKTNKRNTLPAEYSLTWSVCIGMLAGFIITILIGISIDNIAAGIATGPALGAGIGFSIHGYLNRRTKQVNTEDEKRAHKKLLLAYTLLGILLLASVIFYLMN